MTTDIEPEIASDAAQLAIEGDWEGLVERVFVEPIEEARELRLEDFAALDGKLEAPHDTEAEIAVLGSVLLEPSVVPLLLPLICARDFYETQHAELWRVLVEMQATTGVIDVVLLREELQRRGVLAAIGGTSFLSRLVVSVPTAANAEHYARIVRDAARRRLVAGAAEVARRAVLTGDDEAARQALRRAEEARVQPERKRLKFVRGDEILRKAYAPLEWLVGQQGRGLIYRGGITLLVASHKRGKSLTALGLAVRGLVRRMAYPADDEPQFLGCPVTGAGPVVYLSGEGGELLLRLRMEVIEPDLTAEDFRHFVTLQDGEEVRARIDTEEGLGELAEIVRETGAVLLVVDPVSRFWALDDENPAPAMTELFKRLRTWARALNVGVLLVHHDKHRDADASPTSTGGRGSSVLGNEVDTVINLWPDDEDDPKVSRVLFRGRWGEPDPCKVRINPETLLVEFVCTLAGEPGTSQGGEAPRQRTTDLELYDVLQRAGRWVSQTEWADLVGVSTRQLRRRIQGLLRGQSIEEKAEGRSMLYRATSPDIGHRGHSA